MASKDERENAAANAVVVCLTDVLGVELAASKWDDGSAPRMHDFYLEGDSHRIALEVTTIADGQRVGRDVRWERDAPGGWVDVEGLSGCWIAHHLGSTEPTDVIDALRTHLPQLSASGPTLIDTRTWSRHALEPEASRPADYQAKRALNAVGVDLVSPVTDASKGLLNDHGGQVHVSRAFGVDRPADRNFPIAFIQNELAGAHESDVQKLAAARDATARHLWMWVEMTEGFPLIRSFEAEGMPDGVTDFEHLDGVWLGTSPAAGTVAAYYWIRDKGWSGFTTPWVG